MKCTRAEKISIRKESELRRNKYKCTKCNKTWTSSVCIPCPYCKSVKLLRAHKYNAEKTLVDGILFDSQLEADRYKMLKLLERAKWNYYSR